MADGLTQIGEVAERTGLSLRTIRYYEEVGLVVPTGRSQGGFRLYSADDVERLHVVKHMKPLDFTLDDMRHLLSVLDRLSAGADEHETPELLDRLAMFRSAVDTRVELLRTQLAIADSFADQLRRALARGRRRAAGRQR